MVKKSVHTSRYKIFCNSLIQARRSAKISQESLAKKLGKPQTYVSKYERAERRLDIVEFLEVVEALKLDPCQFIKNLKSS